LRVRQARRVNKKVEAEVKVERCNSVILASNLPFVPGLVPLGPLHDGRLSAPPVGEAKALTMVGGDLRGHSGFLLPDDRPAI
jgi:hypothetical protein